MEQNSVDDRISLALTTLRNEMLELRNQDVKLMKQLLQINSTINSLSKTNTYMGRSRRTIVNKERRCISSCMLPISPIIESQCQRRLSVPIIDTSICSARSEGSLFSEHELSESDEDISTRSPNMSRRSSVLSISDCDSVISDEDLLKTNIRVWKLSQSDLSV